MNFLCGQVATENSLSCAWELESFGFDELKVSSKLELFKVYLRLLQIQGSPHSTCIVVQDPK